MSGPKPLKPRFAFSPKAKTHSFWEILSRCIAFQNIINFDKMVECPSLAKDSKFAALLVGDCFLIKNRGIFQTGFSRFEPLYLIYWSRTTTNSQDALILSSLIIFQSFSLQSLFLFVVSCVHCVPRSMLNRKEATSTLLCAPFVDFIARGAISAHNWVRLMKKRAHIRRIALFLYRGRAQPQHKAVACSWPLAWRCFFLARFFSSSTIFILLISFL